MSDNFRRSAFFISDGTGITAETLGLSLLAHFPEVTFNEVRMPFIDTVEKARECLKQILTSSQRGPVYNQACNLYEEFGYGEK